jgi:hypothetical protein
MEPRERAPVRPSSELCLNDSAASQPNDRTRRRIHQKPVSRLTGLLSVVQLSPEGRFWSATTLVRSWHEDPHCAERTE